ncbi:hypothetical protein GCWU000341_00575 [Oribacterium sp. oral taxon 078 str. F0262]|nr:hypothetical protein GCWU000341_00575 [Oribacterium sp. oral taxon 078 str. F0262]
MDRIFETTGSGIQIPPMTREKFYFVNSRQLAPIRFYSLTFCTFYPIL